MSPHDALCFLVPLSHFSIEITHEYYHIIPWYSINFLLQFAVELVYPCLLCVRCWCIYLTYCHSSSCCLEPGRQYPIACWFVTHQSSLGRLRQYQSDPCSM